MKVVDMHCDTISELLHARERGEEASILENHLHIDLNRMQIGDYLLQNFVLPMIIRTRLGRIIILMGDCH